jgi:Helix-turn-helix domain
MKLETVLTWPSVRAIREKYGYSDTWIYSLLSRGILKGFQVGGGWRIDPQSVEQFEKRERRWRNRKSEISTQQ